MGKFTSLACRGVQRRSLWQGQLITDQRWQPTCCQSLYGSPGASWQDKRSGTRCKHLVYLVCQIAASPHRVGSCRLHALWAICSVGDSQKAQREIPVKGVAAKPCAAPLTGVSCCAMKSPPTGNAPEGLSCPQRGRRRKPEGEKLPGSERQRESGGTQGGALRHPPLRSMFQPPTPKKNRPPQRAKTLVP